MPAPALRTIRDILTDATGSGYSGDIEISWNPFTSPDSVTIAGGMKRITVTGGVLDVSLTPGTYTVRYLSTRISKTWTVPSSAGPFTVAQIET